MSWDLCRIKKVRVFLNFQPMHGPGVLLLNKINTEILYISVMLTSDKLQFDFMEKVQGSYVCR